jgi:hypothetical protein
MVTVPRGAATWASMCERQVRRILVQGPQTVELSRHWRAGRSRPQRSQLRHSQKEAIQAVAYSTKEHSVEMSRISSMVRARLFRRSSVHTR